MFTKEMSDDKDLPSVAPTVVFQSQETKKKMSPTKKYAIIGVFSVLLLGLLLTGILVGMHIFTQAQKDLVEYTLKLNGGRSQDVTSDTSSNYVKYHVKDADHDSWVVNDFNTYIKVTKIIKSGSTNCYLTPLNRSTAMEPSQVVAPEQSNVNIPEPTKHDSLIYTIAGEPISDISFLNKVAKDLCQGVSTYWMYPSCNLGQTPQRNTTTSNNKRDAPYWVYSKQYSNGIYYPCINGCCRTVCACKIDYTWIVIGNKISCKWVTWTCCPGTSYCYKRDYCEPTQYLDCTSGTC